MVPEQIIEFAKSGVLNAKTQIKQIKPSSLINTLFNNVYVITTVNNSKRQSKIKNQLESLGINYTLCIMNPPSQELYAIYESWYTNYIEPQQKALDRKPTNFAKLSLGELGCNASHLYVLEQIASSQNPNKSLVLEDDVIFINQFEQRLENVKQHIIDCDFFTLGINDYNISSKNIIKPSINSLYLYSPNPEHGMVYGMHAYSLVPHLATKLISYINTFVRPCDHYLWLLFSNGKTLWPPLIIQERNESNLRTLTNESQSYYFEKCLPGLDKQDYNMCEPLTVVLTYFNPAHYNSIKANFEYTLTNLLTHPIGEIIVVAIEDTTPNLILPNNEKIKLITVKTQSILFHKESLQNIGWKSASNPYILFMDTDIIFETPFWTKKLISILEKKDLVQAWHKATLLDAYGNPVINELSWASQAINNPKSLNVTSFKAHTGFAWAFRRDFLEALENLNIHCVIGSGDQILARALLNSEVQPRHAYMKDAYNKFTKSIQENLKNGFGYLENVQIKHLYHGSTENRKYYERHLYLSELNFNESELTVTNAGIEFVNPEKWNTHFLNYFKGRNEDEDFYIYCNVNKGEYVKSAAAVKKSDVLIIIENNSETSYTKLLNVAELHQDSTLYIYEQLKSNNLSNNISCIDNETKDRLKKHVFYIYQI